MLGRSSAHRHLRSEEHRHCATLALLHGVLLLPTAVILEMRSQSEAPSLIRRELDLADDGRRVDVHVDHQKIKQFQLVVICQTE